MLIEKKERTRQYQLKLTQYRQVPASIAIYSRCTIKYQLESLYDSSSSFIHSSGSFLFLQLICYVTHSILCLISVLSGKNPDSGWWNVQVPCQRSSNYQENTFNVLHKACYCGVYFSDLFIVLASENLLDSPLKLNFWVSDIITPFRINACTTATTFCQHRALLSIWTFRYLI